MASFNLTIEPLEPRDTNAVYCSPLPAGKYNVQRVNFIVENGLDQNVTCQVQGKSKFGVVWQDIGSTFSVPKAALGTPGANASTVDANWGMLRVKLTPAGSPTEGSVAVYVEFGFSGAVV